MVGMLEEIFSKMRNISKDYEIVNCSGKALYIYNHIGIVVFSKEQMVFRVKNKKTIIIVGDDLSINEMDNNSAIIYGNIKSFEVV